MATKYLAWAIAIEAFVAELVRFQIFRRDGLSVAEAGVLLGVSAATAQMYEDATTRLLAALKTETAPGPARPETAPQKAQSNNHEGVTAP